MDDLVGNAAVDYKGLLATRSKTGGIEVSERLSTMGIAVNLVTCLIGTMHLPSATSAKIVSDFMGTSFLLCLLGGVIADSFLGRYRTIAIFAIIQTLGTGMLSISTRPPQLQPTPCNAHYSLKSTNYEQATTSQMSVLYISLYLMALGTGGLKSSVSGFCTDQFDETDGKRKGSIDTIFQLIIQTLQEFPTLINFDVILDKAAILTKEDYECISSLAQNPWRISSVTKVEEVKMIIRLLPIWTTTILFWTAYAQLVTFSVEQASNMERSIGNFRIPAASLTAFFVSAILISLATYDRLIVPFLKNGQQNQFFLVGAGVGFLYTGQLDLFITQSPKGMKTMSTGLFLTTMALGFFFSSLLISIVKKVTTTNINNGWIGKSINKGRLDCFYGLLAILIFIDFGFYVLSASWYTSKIIC
ncbi:hypothetical protein H5410_041524 [Solanum commersonii]|uniref:Uncharacterized protein n=1 Tax=Solanum commersonii TaxID=4109 RepID=A0A9J5XTC5_SOLCO|nr:hypothetical protein H5410_041524 [Solanum commersonii]